MIRSQIIIPSSGVIDLYEDVPISLNYNIADIKEPDKRQTAYSKTIRIPGSQNNNKMFMHIWDISTDNQFDVTKKVLAILMTDNTEVMRGYMQLLKITNLGFKKIEYEIVIFGMTANLFYALGNNRFSALDLTGVNHTLNRTNVAASWDYLVNYVYPFLDLGYSPDGITYDISSLRPALKLKYLFDKILTYAGFTYTSTFLNGNFFSRLIALNLTSNYTNDSTTIYNNSFRATVSVLQQISTYYVANLQMVNADTDYDHLETSPELWDIGFNNDSAAPNHDAGNIFSTATNEATIGLTGKYSINVNCNVHFTVPSGTAEPAIKVWGIFLIKRNGVWKTFGTTNPYIWFPTLEPPPSAAGNISLSIPSIILKSGELIKMQIMYQHTGSTYAGVTGDYMLNVQQNSYFEVNLLPELFPGMTIPGNVMVSRNASMKDFLISIIKAFNLYVSVDKETPNKLIIEPRDDYYTSGVIDWSQKLDVSKNLEINPISAKEASKYIFTYKKDTDYLNALYESHFGEIYGQRTIDTHNDFLPNEKKTELIFSPTPLFRSGISDRYINRIYVLNNNTEQPYASESWRLLYYAGLQDCQGWRLFDINASPQTVAYQHYPYAGHIDNPVTPSVDLSFGIPRELYYAPIQDATYTDNNLYNVYWRKFINEITDKNSKIITAYFHLFPSDINQLDFQKLYYFAGDYFRLNKIYDYNPIKEGVTKCEFFKVVTKATFTSGSHLLTGGRGDVSTDDNHDWPNIGVITVGRGNIVAAGTGTGGTGTSPESATKKIVQGNDNVIGERCEEIFLMGSSGNIIPGGLKQITMINTSGRTATKDGDFYMDGFKRGAVRVNTKRVQENTTIDRETYHHFCDSSTGTIILQLQTAQWDGEYKLNGMSYYFRKTTIDGNKVIVSAILGETIDGKTHFDLENPAPLRVGIVSDGTNWWSL